jgi:hypothetical protein
MPSIKQPVADEAVRAMVDDVVARPVEVRSKQPLRDRHADGVRESLAERTGRRFHTWCQSHLRVAGCFRVQLAEALDLLDRQVVSREMQKRVKQHRAMTVGDHEAVAIRPFGVCGVVDEMALPERDGDLGHTHGHARMAAFRRFHGVHRECAYRIRELGSGYVVGHEDGPIEWCAWVGTAFVSRACRRIPGEREWQTLGAEAQQN